VRPVNEMRDEPRHDQLVEELRLLLDAVAGKAEEYLHGCGGQDVQADGGAGCGWCPLCATVALVRGRRPELNEQLAGMVQLLRQVLADQCSGAPRTAGTPESSESSEEDGSAEPATPKVERIRVQRVGGSALAEDETGAVVRC
jgi:hypothetical protein